LKNIVVKLELKSVAIVFNANLSDAFNEFDVSQNQITVITLDSDDSSSIQEDLNKLERVFKQLRIEIKTNNNPLQRLDLNLLDTIIKSELTNSGIDLDYAYAVLSDKSKLVYSSNNFTNENLNSKYKINLFSNDITQKDYFLIIDFIDTYNFLFKSVAVLAAFSLLFTLIIIAVFIYTLKIIIRQKKLSEIKSDFINNITHELKTPIASLKIAIKTLKIDKSIAKSSTLDLIERQGNKLQTITDRILDSSFNNVPTLKKEIVNAGAFFHTLINDFKNTADDVDWEDVNTIKSDILIKIDKYYLSVAINNVLENAVKYNDKKHKKVLVKSKISGKYLIIYIIDNGMGIAAKDKNRIFDKFYRGLTDDIHNVKGLGIGLFFAKQIIELHQGEISFESSKNKGTTFILKLPVYD
jgi:signal transduction histidine kinase